MSRQKKYYRISDLINDYMKLQKEFEKFKIYKVKDQISLLEFILDGAKKSEMETILLGLKCYLKELVE